MFMRRRRPLMGAAMLGGAAYAGRRSARASDREADQEARLEQLEAQQQQPQYAPPPQAAPAPAAAPAAQGAPDGIAGQLKQLADLKQSGVLSDEEFEAAKQKLLAS
jgi:hypothetical protein